MEIFQTSTISKDGRFAAAVRATYNSPPEVFGGPLDEWRQLTNNNSGLQATWGKAESIEWTNEGQNIQGWLVPPCERSKPEKNIRWSCSFMADRPA